MAPIVSLYRTIEAPSQAIVREKMSRFLAFAFPADSVEEAKEHIASIANKYHDARHVCWAYMVGGASNPQFLSTDNGEPSGTAGKPILGQIRSLGLTNVVVIVVRYFGGIKLGTSGLIVAYREAARLALSEAVTVERHEQATLTFHFPYMAMNSVMRVVKDPDVRIITQQFDNACFMELQIRADRAQELQQRLTSIDGVTMA